MAAWLPPIARRAADAMDTTALERLDSFPYRHRVGELMTGPVVAIDQDRPVAEATRLMSERRISSVIVLDGEGRLHGILTERDVLRLVAAGPGGLANPVLSAMTTPVHAIEADAPVYRALARMARLGVRHLPVVDDHDRPIGMLTSGALLKQRASLALTLGDEIALAPDGNALRAIHDRLPTLVRALRNEDVSATQASSVVSGIGRDLAARAGELALAAMKSAGQAEPPAPWCLLVLGSAGRGESLLAPDQDNALIHEGERGGRRLVRGLRRARQPAARRSRRALLHRRRDGQEPGISPFARRLAGTGRYVGRSTAAGGAVGRRHLLRLRRGSRDRRLAGALRQHATSAARSSPAFLRLLAAAGEEIPRATDLLGRLRTREGRIDLKRHGLFPIVTGARVVALAWGSTATATDMRLADAAAKGAFAGRCRTIAHRCARRHRRGDPRPATRRHCRRTHPRQPGRPQTARPPRRFAVARSPRRCRRDAGTRAMPR